MADEHPEPHASIDPQQVPPPPPPPATVDDRTEDTDETVILPVHTAEQETARQEPLPPPPPKFSQPDFPRTELAQPELPQPLPAAPDSMPPAESVPAESVPAEPVPVPQPPMPPHYTQERDFLLQPAAAQPATGPSVMALTWRAIVEAPLKIWRGKPLDALEQVHEVKEKTGNAWAVWVIVLALNSGLLALTLTALIARSFSLLYLLAPYSFPGFDLRFTAPQLLLVFLLMTITVAFGLAARGTGLYLTQRTAGATVGFQRAVTSYAASQMLYTLPLAVVTILALLGGMGVAWPLVAVVAAGLGIMVQIVNYIAVLSDGPHRFSPLVPFAWFTILASVFAATVQGLVLTAVL